MYKNILFILIFILGMFLFSTNKLNIVETMRNSYNESLDNESLDNESVSIDTIGENEDLQDNEDLNDNEDLFKNNEYNFNNNSCNKNSYNKKIDIISSR